MSAGRKSTDSNASQPAFKIVGFHVEGVPPSPDHGTLLQDALTSGGGSPDPVIIPPSFQVRFRCCYLQGNNFSLQMQVNWTLAFRPAFI